MTENIVEFPKHKIVRVIEDKNLDFYKERSKKTFADSVSQEIWANFLNDLNDFGIDYEGDKCEKDLYFLSGVITATVYRALDLEHGFHSFVDQHIKLIDSKEIDSNEPPK